ncbi:MAG: SLBB domain-containing protein [Methylophilaceae bacterium]
MRQLILLVFSLFLGISSQFVTAEDAGYKLGPGDLLKITVHNNPDLSLETRIPEDGAISFPLIGKVPVGSLTASDAEKKIADKLDSGGFVKKPQVNILVTGFQSKVVAVLGGVSRPGRYTLERATNLTDLLALVGGPTLGGSDLVTVISKAGKMEYDIGTILNKGSNAQNVSINGGDIVYVHSNDVSVLGQVNRPGKYPISGGVRTLTDFLTIAGGITAVGADTIVVNTLADGNFQHIEIDINKTFRSGGKAASIILSSGDTIFVPRAPQYYIYGEVQRPGAFRVERDMTVMQALAQGGGPTARGTQRGLKIHRKNAQGKDEEISPALTDKVLPDDVLYVKESLF